MEKKKRIRLFLLLHAERIFHVWKYGTVTYLCITALLAIHTLYFGGHIGFLESEAMCLWMTLKTYCYVLAVHTVYEALVVLMRMKNSQQQKNINCVSVLSVILPLFIPVIIEMMIMYMTSNAAAVITITFICSLFAKRYVSSRVQQMEREIFSFNINDHNFYKKSINE